MRSKHIRWAKSGSVPFTDLRENLLISILLGQGGSITYGPDQLEAVKHAIIGFNSDSDQRASIIFTFIYASGGVCADIPYGTASEALTRFSDSHASGSVL